jgi:RNA polymerase sigma factor (sigma-70 family)
MTFEQFRDDIHLLQRITRQDQAALSDLYDRYARVVNAIAFRMLGSAEEAEEVVLDVFAQVWRTAGNYDSKRGRVDAWLFLLARSRALDRLRSLKRSSRSVTASQSAFLDQTRQSPPDPVENLLISERRDRVLAALELLPSEQRQVLELAYFGGLTHVEIATQTGIALGTIKTRIRLGLSKLRDSLQHWE